MPGGKYTGGRLKKPHEVDFGFSLPNMYFDKNLDGTVDTAELADAAEVLKNIGASDEAVYDQLWGMIQEPIQNTPGWAGMNRENFMERMNVPTLEAARAKMGAIGPDGKPMGYLPMYRGLQDLTYFNQDPSTAYIDQQNQYRQGKFWNDQIDEQVKVHAEQERQRKIRKRLQFSFRDTLTEEGNQGAIRRWQDAAESGLLNPVEGAQGPYYDFNQRAWVYPNRPEQNRDSDCTPLTVSPSA